jgi:transposase
MVVIMLGDGLVREWCIRCCSVAGREVGGIRDAVLASADVLARNV